MAVKDVRGNCMSLTNGRLVFVGRSLDHPDSVFIAFRSEEGFDTKLVLSAEAAEALQRALSQPWGDTVFPQGGRTGWRLVQDVAVDA